MAFLSVPDLMSALFPLRSIGWTILSGQVELKCWAYTPVLLCEPWHKQHYLPRSSWLKVVFIMIVTTKPITTADHHYLQQNHLTSQTWNAARNASSTSLSMVLMSKTGYSKAPVIQCRPPCRCCKIILSLDPVIADYSWEVMETRYNFVPSPFAGTVRHKSWTLQKHRTIKDLPDILTLLNASLDKPAQCLCSHMAQVPSYCTESCPGLLLVVSRISSSQIGQVKQSFFVLLAEVTLVFIVLVRL